MPLAKQNAPTDTHDSDLTAWHGDDRELDDLARRLATGGASGATIVFQALGAPQARRLGKELRRRADSDPASRPIYERAVTELICADLANYGPKTKLPEAEESTDAAKGIAPAQASSVD